MTPKEAIIKTMHLLRSGKVTTAMTNKEVVTQVLGSWDADGWISVEEQLPPKESEYDDNSIEVLATDGNGVYKGIYRSDEFLSGWFTHDLLELDNITHWMPLPQPPKKGGEA